MPDSILYWNDVALEADRITHTREPKEQVGPILSSRALAIVHLAMYDAYSAIVPAARHPGGGGAYLPGLPPPPPGASAQAAVSGAAYATLSALYPSQQSLFDAKLGAAGNALNPGHDFGVEVARLILMDRRNDPGVGERGI
jgi:hypothetical protein